MIHFFTDYSLYTLISLSVLAFVAGFLDAVVGGGGLVQIPALLINFPKLPLPTIFGTNKIAALSGTTISAYQYSKIIKFNYILLFTVSIFAFASSYSGAKVVSLVNANALKPIILVVLIIIAIYTFIKKDLGSYHAKSLSLIKQVVYGCLIGTIVGFYDGFFGPGTGSFFVLGFVIIIGFEFVTASAYAKIINCVTNLSALVVFIKQGNYLLGIAILMAVFNIVGSIIGSKMAIRKGNSFVRIIFLVIVSLMILRYSYDIFFA